jgi:phage antirepressor YoqD-like protein
MSALQNITNSQLSMTSREIADLCEARHNDVVDTIERQFKKGLLRESRNSLRTYQAPGGGRPTMVYDLTKRDSLVVVSGYNEELRARIIDRWMELEAAKTLALPQSFSAALRLAAEQQEVIERQQAELAYAKPALEFVDKYVKAEDGKGFLEVCKLLGVKGPQFRAFLCDQKIMYRLGRDWAPYAQHLDSGRFVMKTGTAQNDHAFTRALFTPKGVNWIAGEWAKHQLRGHVPFASRAPAAEVRA